MWSACITESWWRPNSTVPSTQWHTIHSGLCPPWLRVTWNGDDDDDFVAFKLSHPYMYLCQCVALTVSVELPKPKGRRRLGLCNAPQRAFEYDILTYHWTAHDRNAGQYIRYRKPMLRILAAIRNGARVGIGKAPFAKETDDGRLSYCTIQPPSDSNAVQTMDPRWENWSVLKIIAHLVGLITRQPDQFIPSKTTGNPFIYMGKGLVEVFYSISLDVGGTSGRPNWGDLKFGAWE